jgi:hypothetical protein
MYNHESSPYRNLQRMDPLQLYSEDLLSLRRGDMSDQQNSCRPYTLISPTWPIASGVFFGAHPLK